MQILLDDNPCDLEATTVGQAIEAAAAVARERGRLIVEVTVDGLRWSDDDLASLDRRNAPAEVLHLTSAVPRDLVSGVLADASDALTDADSLQREAAELLQSDERIVALDRLHDAISIWHSVQESILKGSTAVGLDLDSVSVDGRPISEAVGALDGRLRLVRRALVEQDLIALSDALLYEFPDVVDQWRRILAELRSRVRGEG